MTEQAAFLPKRQIGDFSATVTITETHADELQITEHPVQQGADIADHAYKKPAEITVECGWNDDDAPLSETYAKLLELQEKREPFDVITGKRAYKNMLIKSLRVDTDAQSENILRVQFELREVFITALEVVAVPSREKQAQPQKTQATQNAGKKQATKPGQAKSGSNAGKNGAAGATIGATERKRSALAALAGKGK